MKAIVSFLVMLMCAIGSVAQTTGLVSPKSDQNGTTSDTLANATTDYQTLKLNGGWKVVTIQVVAKRLSGAAAGTGTIEVSNNGVDFKAHPTASTFSLTDVASNSYLVELANYGYTHLRIKLVGSGTQSTRWYSYVKYAGAL